jgi:hypothetical protein
MKFDDLVNYILKEAKKGVDPLKYVATGPAGFRKDTGLTNPQKAVNVKGLTDEGKRIEQDAYRTLRAALLVAASDPQTGIELKRVFEEFGKAYLNYKNNVIELRTMEDKLSKSKNPESEAGLILQDRIKEYTKLTKQAKDKVEELTPDMINSVHDLVREGGKNFVDALRASKGQEFKSLDDLEMKVEGDDEKRTIAFLSDMWKGKSEFKPLSNFVEIENQAGRNPGPRLLTNYKTVIDLMVRNNLVGSPERTFNFITGQANKIRSIAEPTKGRTVMKQKDPALLRVISFIKDGKYTQAKNVVNDTKLDYNDKAVLMMKIDKLSKGELSEADVIRPLYQ